MTDIIPNGAELLIVLICAVSIFGLANLRKIGNFCAKVHLAIAERFRKKN